MAGLKRRGVSLSYFFILFKQEDNQYKHSLHFIVIFVVSPLSLSLSLLLLSISHILSLALALIPSGVWWRQLAGIVLCISFAVTTGQSVRLFVTPVSSINLSDN